MKTFLFITIVLCALSFVRGGQSDRAFTGDGYKIELVGKSGKLKVFQDESSNDFLMLTMDRLQQVSAEDGSVLEQIPSWASQQFVWGNTSCDEDAADEKAPAVKACFTKNGMKFGNNGPNARTIDMYCEVRIINESYWSLYLDADGNELASTDEADRCGQDNRETRYCNGYRKLGWDSEIDDCSSTCLASYHGDGNTPLGCSRCEGTLPNGTVVYTAHDSASEECPLFWCFQASSGAAAATDVASCADDADGFTTNVSLTKFTSGLENCTHYPTHAVKFKLRFANVEWIDGDEGSAALKWGVQIASNGQVRATSGDATEFDNGMYIQNNRDITVCNQGSAGDNCFESSMLSLTSVEAENGVRDEYTFPHFTRNLTYDPIIGSGGIGAPVGAPGGSSTSGGMAAGTAAGIAVGTVLAVIAIIVVAVVIRRRRAPVVTSQSTQDVRFNELDTPDLMSV